MRYIKVLFCISLFLLPKQFIFSSFDCHCLRGCCLFGFFFKQRIDKQKKNDDSTELTVRLDEQVGTVAPPNSPISLPIVIVVLPGERVDSPALWSQVMYKSEQLHDQTGREAPHSPTVVHGKKSVQNSRIHSPSHRSNVVCGLETVKKESELLPKPVSRTDSWDSNRPAISSGGFRHVDSVVVIASPTAKETSGIPVHRIAPGSASWDSMDDQEFTI